MAKKRQTTGLPKQAKISNSQEVSSEQSSASLLERIGVVPPGGEYTSHAQREEIMQRRVVIGVGAALTLVAILIAAVFIWQALYIPGQSVATVNDDNIGVIEFQDRVRLERAIIIEQINNVLNDYMEQQGTDVNAASQVVLSTEPFSSWWNELNIPDQMGIRVLDDMIDDRLIRDAANELGITVTEEEIDQKINELIGYDPEAVAAIGTDPTSTPEPTNTPTPLVSPTPSLTPDVTPTEAVSEEAAADTTEDTATTESDDQTDTDNETNDEIQVTAVPTSTPEPALTRDEVEANYLDQRQEFLSSIQSASGLSESAVRDYFATLVLRDKLVEELEPGEGTGYFVDVRHILVNTEEEAQTVMDALEAGESFAELAKSASQDQGSAQAGGELGMRGTFEFVPEFANAAENAEIGEIVGPVESDFGYHILQVRSREERELTESQLNSNRARIISNWIEQTRAEESENYEIYSIWVDYVPQRPGFVFEQR